MSFQDNLGKQRTKANLSQEALAAEMSVSRQTISKWENGDSYPSTKHLLMLTRILKCKLEDLLDTDLLSSPRHQNRVGVNQTTIGDIGKTTANHSGLDTTAGYSRSDTITSHLKPELRNIDAKQKRYFYWAVGAFAVAIIMLLGVVAVNSKPENKISDYQTAIFDKIVDGSFDDVLEIAGYTKKRVLGYGVTEDDGTFYIKCELEQNGENAPCAAIIYFCKNDGGYSCEYQYLDDPDFLPKGEYHRVG